MKSPVQDESTNDLPVPTGPFVSKEKESDVEQGSKRMQQNPAKKELSHVTWQKYSTTLKPWYSEQVYQTLFVHYIE